MIRHKKAIYEAFASAARTADVNSAAFDAEPYDHAIIHVDMSTWTSGTYQFFLEFSPDAGTSWHRLTRGNTDSDPTGTPMSTRLFPTGTLAIGEASKTSTIFRSPIGSLVRVAAVGDSPVGVAFSCDLELVRESA